MKLRLANNAEMIPLRADQYKPLRQDGGGFLEMLPGILSGASGILGSIIGGTGSTGGATGTVSNTAQIMQMQNQQLQQEVMRLQNELSAARTGKILWGVGGLAIGGIGGAMIAKK